jgi:hypothetical protein
MAYLGQEIVREHLTFGWKGSIHHFLQLLKRPVDVWKFLHGIKIQPFMIVFRLPLLVPLRLSYPANTCQQGERRLHPRLRKPLVP